MNYLQYQQDNDPLQEQRMEAIERFTQDYIQNPSAQRSTITIPVVFHVVYRTSTENISDAQIQTQLDVLNEDFRRLNGDKDNTWAQAADTEIEFCLATVDPNGNTTSGITRTSTNKSSFGTNDAVKSNNQGGKNAWPADKYMNFWICNIGNGILGYAQFPGGPASTDGVVCDYRYTGTIGTATAPFDKGRTATHEVGHYLNLRHIWGDGNCNADDFVADTPASDASNGGCSVGHVSCNSVDMVQNYMDYSDDACMNLFTQGQKDRMQALFAPGGARYSLVNSTVCGSTPPPPPPGCSGTEVRVAIVLDNYPAETTWSIVNSNGTEVASGGAYSTPNSTVNVDVCLADGCYDFVINDSYGDGICCSFGNGSYNVLDGGTILVSGGQFTNTETKSFCLSSGPTATCTDGQQNGDETGVDCGGSSCPACPTCNDGQQNGDETDVDCGGSTCPPCSTGGCTDVDYDGFESGWGIWNDGGTDSYRSKAYPNSGTYCIRLRDNSGSASSMTTDQLPLAGTNQVTIDFSYYPVSMENGEDFWYDISVDNGNTWYNIKNWVRGVDFNNNERKYEQVVATGGFTDQTKVRLRCDASSNSDYVYIDDVSIEACVNNGNRTDAINLADLTPVNGDERRPSATPEFSTESIVTDLVLFPNPTAGLLNVRFEMSQTSGVEYSILDIHGKILKYQVENYKMGTQFIKFDGSDLPPGCYFLKLTNGEQHFIEKFIIAQ